MELTLESIDITDIESGGHGDGNDKYGNFVSSHWYYANLNIKERNLIMPMGFVIFHGYANPEDENRKVSITELSSIALSDMSWSYQTEEAKQAEANAQKIFKENGIDENLLELLVMQKLSVKYNIAEKLKKSLQAYGLSKDLNKELSINNNFQNKLKI